jgi:hypothetical protein
LPAFAPTTSTTDYIDALLDPPAEVITAVAGHWPRFAACAVSSTCGAISSRMPTSERWHSSNERNSSHSTADSGATHGCVGVACSTTEPVASPWRHRTETVD